MVSSPNPIRILEPLLRTAFVLLIFGVYERPDRLVSNAVHYGKRAWNQGLDYQAIRKSERDIESALDAQRYLVPSARWGVSETRRMWTTNRVRYVLYPNMHDEKNWDVFLDIAGSIKTPQSNWLKQPLSTGAVLYARNGKFRTPPLEAIPSYSNTSSFLAFGFVTALQVLAGIALLALLDVPVATGAFWFISSAYLLGFVTLHAASWALLIAGAPFRAAVVATTWLTLTTGIVLAAHKRLRPLFNGLATRDALLFTLPSSIVGWSALALVLFVVTVQLIPIVLVPAWSFDVMGHWFFKAKALLQHQSLAFLSDCNVPEYPIIWTLQAATLFLFGGGPHDEMMQWTNALIIVVALVQIHGAVGFLGVDRSWRWIIVLFYMTFFFQDCLTWSYADTPFVAYTAALIATLALAWTHRNEWRFVALAAAMATGLCLIKLEGGVSTLILAGAYLLVQPGFARSRRAWAIFMWLALPIVLPLAWKIYVAHLGLNGGTHLREPLTWARAELIGVRLVDSVDGLGMGWRLFCGAALIILLRPVRAWNRFEVCLGISAVFLVLFTGGALIGWTTPNIDKQTLTATDRLILHATPALLVLLGSLFASEHGAYAVPESAPQPIEESPVL